MGGKEEKRRECGREGKGGRKVRREGGREKNHDCQAFHQTLHSKQFPYWHLVGDTTLIIEERAEIK